MFQEQPWFKPDTITEQEEKLRTPSQDIQQCSKMINNRMKNSLEGNRHHITIHLEQVMHRQTWELTLHNHLLLEYKILIFSLIIL
jgi:hypothetical protein